MAGRRSSQGRYGGWTVLGRDIRAALRSTALVVGAALVASGCGSAGSSKTVKIGVLLPLTGPSAATGKIYQSGVDYWRSVAANQTVLGRTIRLIVADDQGTAQGGIDAATKLIKKDHVSAITGDYESPVVKAVLPLVTQAQVLYVPYSAQPAAGDAATNPTSFQIEFTLGVQASANVANMASFGKSRLGVLTVDSDVGAAETAAYGAVQDAKARVVDIEKFPPGAKDATAQAQNLIRAGVDAIAIGTGGPGDTITGVTALFRSGWNGIAVVDTSFFGAPERSVDRTMFNRLVIGSYAGNVLNPLPTPVTNWRDGYKAFAKQVVLHYPLYLPLDGYDALGLVRTAYAATGGTNVRTIRTYLEANGYDGLKAHYQFSPTDHQGLRPGDAKFAQPGTFDDGAYGAARVDVGPALELPSIVGKPYLVAAKFVQNLGLTAAPPKLQLSPDVPYGVVMSQDPAPRAQVHRGDTVTLTVSSGPTPVNIPDVTGQSTADATKALVRAGFSVRSSTESSSTVPAGSIIRTDPSANTPAPGGLMVTIVVAN